MVGSFQAQEPEVAAHPGLVGDDRGVLGVGLAFAAVGVGGAVDRDAGYVQQPVAAGE